MKLIKLIASLAVSFAAAGIGALATTPNIPTWYAQLDKPFFSPPNWVFGPVWTVLYVMIGISLYVIWTNMQSVNKNAYVAFGTQLMLNALWCIVFFGLHLPWLGVIVTATLFVSIVWTMKLFWPVSRVASWLLVPYALWVSFASALTLAIALMN